MTHLMRHQYGIALVISTVACGMALAQTSSLYLDPEAAPQKRYATINGIADRLSPHISQTSIAAVRLPAPRQFGIHDLITIIVRESIENESESDIETEKSATVQGTIPAFPNLQLRDLLNLQLGQSSMDDGQPSVNINLSNDYEGSGEYERKDTFTTRITSRIIDIKPNGTLVLEARKFIQSDEETINVILTGTCRKEDIAGDNTVLSTQIYDLNLVKQHTGELRKATKKGLITKFFETLFNF